MSGKYSKVSLRIRNGIWYGYPKCCIRSFINNEKRTIAQKLYSDNHVGFVPCDSCANKLLTGEISIDDLLSKRKCSVSFGINSPGYEWDFKNETIIYPNETT